MVWMIRLQVLSPDAQTGRASAIEPRWVVNFRAVRDAYRAAGMAAMVSVSLLGCRSAMEVSDR